MPWYYSFHCSNALQQKIDTHLRHTDAILIPYSHYDSVLWSVGILNVASSIVDVIKHFFPQFIDNLEREKAVFAGPKPLLLIGSHKDDLTTFISKSNQRTSDVRQDDVRPTEFR